jgi:hypothetical protein
MFGSLMSIPIPTGFILLQQTFIFRDSGSLPGLPGGSDHLMLPCASDRPVQRASTRSNPAAQCFLLEDQVTKCWPSPGAEMIILIELHNLKATVFHFYIFSLFSVAEFVQFVGTVGSGKRPSLPADWLHPVV